MAERQQDKEPKVAEDEEVSSEASGADEVDGAGDALARAGEPDSLETTEEEGEEDTSPTQLGIQRYVLAGFFAAGMLSAYVLGRALHALWSWASNKDAFSRAVPMLAAIPDEEKSTISLAVGAIVALIMIVRVYRRPDVRAWTDEVAGELAKVKWPTRKDVWNSTVIVIAASTVATVYLALLDRLWAFVTNLVYGDGS